MFKWIYIYIHCDHILRASLQAYYDIVRFLKFINKEVYMLVKEFWKKSSHIERVRFTSYLRVPLLQIDNANLMKKHKKGNKKILFFNGFSSVNVL